MTGQHYTGSPATADTQFLCGLLQATLVAKKVSSIVAPAWDGPQLRVFSVSLGLGETPEAVERLSGALAMAAGAENCRVSRDGGKVLLEIPKRPEERRVLHASRLEQFSPPSPTAVALGVGVHGRVVWHDVATEAHSHTVCGGTTGSGKSVLTAWVLLRLCLQNTPAQLQVLAMDPKGYELDIFRQSAHLAHPVQQDPTEAARLLRWVVDEMDRRARSRVRSPRYLVVVEEVADLLAVNRDIEPMLTRIVQLGRALSINLWLSTQQPGTASLGRTLPNMTARIIGRVSSSTLTYGASGRAKSGADELLGAGDFVRVSAGEVLRFQAPLANGKQWAQLPRTHEVSTLEDQLPTLAYFGDRNVDPRGGRGRRELGQDAYRAMEQALADGARPDDLKRAFGIGYERARRIYDAYRGADDEE